MINPTLYILGDSFSASTSELSWSSLLTKYYNVVNYASNGSSEYRIWKRAQEIEKNKLTIFCHTSPTRIFLKNSEHLSSRSLSSHVYCDIIINDIFSKKEKQFIDILEKIWDEQFFHDTYTLLINDLQNKFPKSLHICFFNNSEYFNIWKKYPGNINHMSEEGNLQVFELLVKSLEKYQ